MGVRMLLAAALLVLGTSARAAVEYPIKVIDFVQLSATPDIDSVTVFSVDDALSAAFTLYGAANKPGGKGMIRHLRVMGLQSTTVGFELMLFSRTFTASAKNAAWTPLTGEVSNSYIGKITVLGSAWIALGANASYAEVLDVDLPYDLPRGQDDLQCQLVLRLWDNSFAADNLVVKLDAAWVK